MEDNKLEFDNIAQVIETLPNSMSFAFTLPRILNRIYFRMGDPSFFKNGSPNRCKLKAMTLHLLTGEVSEVELLIRQDEEILPKSNKEFEALVRVSLGVTKDLQLIRKYEKFGFKQ